MVERAWDSVHIHEIDSTNEFLEKWDGDCPIFVSADIQTKGKGRREREWNSPEGGLYLSFCFKDDLDDRLRGILPLATGICVVKALAKQGIDAGLKWPNDVLVEGKKVAGILASSSPRKEGIAYIVGIGINVQNDPPLPTSTSLKLHSDNITIADTLITLKDEIHAMVEKFHEANWVESYKDHCLTIGKSVKVVTAKGDKHGKAVDIGVDGSLIIEGDEGRETVLSGDCVHLE